MINPKLIVALGFLYAFMAMGGHGTFAAQSIIVREGEDND
jgi:hypothetical protein